MESNDEMRVRCFEKTGCLLTWLVSANHDKKIKPQGIPEGRIKVPTERSLENLDNIHELPEGIGAEEAAIQEKQDIIDEEAENEDICFDEDIDDGSEIHN